MQILNTIKRLARWPWRTKSQSGKQPFYLPLFKNPAKTVSPAHPESPAACPACQVKTGKMFTNPDEARRELLRRMADRRR